MKTKLTTLLLLFAATNLNAQLQDMPVEQGTYHSNWQSLSAWECPEWFRDAKFGIWAHWDPQCEAEDGDWYARSMYGKDSHQWNTFRSIFGAPPSKTLGYKDLCDHWKADKWDPEALIQLYADAGAKYFMTMGQHHDNFDCWDSPYQEWNSTRIGPMKDIVGGWAEACRKHGLKVGVSMHGAHAWTFFEIGWDYDVKLTKEDGLATNSDGSFKYWWHGLDPQELYAQNHAHSANWSDWGTIHNQWGWGNGVCPPSVEYMQKFQNRVLQCIDKYNPDMLYFDDTVLPFYGASTNTDDQYSLNILTHFYNHSANLNNGEQQVVVTGKILNDMHKQAMLWDVERGIPDRCQDLPWQTCTCIGGWHYSKSEADNNQYKSAETVIRMLVDIVSKNGNLLLSIPIRGNGTIDNNEKRIVAGIKAWMDVNKESIYETRPWKVYGEGPLFDSANPLNAQGFNEGINYSDKDVRYVQKGGIVYATIMRWPSTKQFTFKSFGKLSTSYSGKVESVRLLGGGDVTFCQDAEGLTVDVPTKHPNEIAPVFAITFDPTAPQTLTLQEVIDIYQEKVDELQPQVSNNTGKPNATKLEAFSDLLADYRLKLSGLSESEQQTAISSLHTAYNVFVQTGFNPAGTPDDVGRTDVTLDYLIEKSNFAATEMGSRFGKPVNWAVENFSVPQNDTSKGAKNGIDNYPGSNCLMVGIWQGEDGSYTRSTMANARIYRSVHLHPGTYFFGAKFDAVYQLGTAYVYVAAEPLKTATVARDAIAYLSMSKCATGDQFYGVNFTLTQEQDVVLCFQANMSSGSNTQEFRVKEVKLTYSSDVRANTNEDITKDKLIQASNFSRVSGQSTTTRYGTPANWTVENYRIPAGGDGTRNGLDRYPGYDCLTLGVWDDRQNNTEGDLSNARVYRKVQLDAGSYYFGATYEANYQLAEAYIFAASEPLNTSDIPSRSIAFDPIANAGKDNTTFRGIYFKLPEAQEVILGFQADLASGAAEQEFRASKVTLLSYNVVDGIREIIHNSQFIMHNDAIYDLQGRRVNSSLSTLHSSLFKGVYVIDERKILVK